MQGISKKVQYRRTTSADVLSIAELRWRLKTNDDQFANQARHDQFIAAFTEWYQTKCDHRSIIHWVAETDGDLVAILSVVLVNKVAAPDAVNCQWGYLTNCYALPNVRNRGVGSELLAEVKKWAETEGLEMLVVWPSDRSYPFYERAGFRRNRDPLVLSLEN